MTAWTAGDEAALERVRAVAEGWAAASGDDVSTEIDRHVGTTLLAAIRDIRLAPAARVSRVTELAEGWLAPGGPGLTYPEAGLRVLEAIRGEPKRAPSLLEIYADLRQLMADYADTERDVIAGCAFAASLDQLFTEKYGMTLP